MPAAGGSEESGELGGAPGAGFVIEEGHGVGEDGVHDAPGLLDGVFTREEAGVAMEGVGEETLVGGHLVGGLVLGGELGGLTGEELARPFGIGAEGNDDLGAELEAVVVGGRRVVSSKMG